MDAHTPTQSTFRRLVRLAWYPVAIAALALLIVSLPGYLTGFVFPVEPESSSAPTVVLLMQLLAVLASLACAGICLGLAALLFFRRGEDNMALFVSFYLLVYGVVMGGPLEAALQQWERSAAVAYSIQTAILILPTVALLFTFPSGHFVPRWSIWLTLLSAPLTLAAIFRPGSEWLSLSSTPIRLQGAGIGHPGRGIHTMLGFFSYPLKAMLLPRTPFRALNLAEGRGMENAACGLLQSPLPPPPGLSSGCLVCWESA